MATRARFVGQFKQIFNEYPEHVLTATATTIIGLCCGTTMYFFYKRGGNNRRYKRMPVYMRPDDPRVVLVHKD